MIRIAVAWLLALALPAQGLAAVAMLSCAPGHARMAQAAANAAAPARDAHSGLHDSTPGDAAGLSVPGDMAGAPAPGDAAGASADGAAAACSACAACGAAPVLPVSAGPAAGPRCVAEAIPDRPGPEGDFLVGRPDHPPRPHEA